MTSNQYDEHRGFTEGTKTGIRLGIEDGGSELKCVLSDFTEQLKLRIYLVCYFYNLPHRVFDSWGVFVSCLVVLFC